MIRYSIADVVSGLREGTDKIYLRTYREHGYELGFGRGGSYPGHSHLYFLDLILSYGQIGCSDAWGSSISDSLVIVPPQTYLGDVVCGDFFFIKFCPAQHTVIFPEKLDEVMDRGEIIHATDHFNRSFSYYKDGKDERRSLQVHLANNTLVLTVGSDEYEISP
jgi:hypothetical protein